GGRVIPVLLQITREIPIVVPGTVDPIATGWVKSLARPGGNITGFTLMEFSIFGKLLDLLKQLAPDTVRVGLVFNPDNPSSLMFRREIATFAGPLGIEPVVFPIHGLADIDRAIATLAERSNSAVFFLPDITVLAMAAQVVELVRERGLLTRRRPSTISRKTATAARPTTSSPMAWAITSSATARSNRSTSRPSSVWFPCGILASTTIGASRRSRSSTTA